MSMCLNAQSQYHNSQDVLCYQCLELQNPWLDTTMVIIEKTEKCKRLTVSEKSEESLKRGFPRDFR